MDITPRNGKKPGLLNAGHGWGTQGLRGPSAKGSALRFGHSPPDYLRGLSSFIIFLVHANRHIMSTHLLSVIRVVRGVLKLKPFCYDLFTCLTVLFFLYIDDRLTTVAGTFNLLLYVICHATSTVFPMFFYPRKR